MPGRVTRRNSPGAARTRSVERGRLVAIGWNRYVSAFTCGGKIFYGLDEAGGPRDLRSPTCRRTQVWPVIFAHRGAFRFGQEGGAHEADQQDDRHHGAAA